MRLPGEDWIIEREEELAVEIYDKEYDDLTEEEQSMVHEKAAADYIDDYSAQLDAAYDMWKENQLFKEIDTDG